MDSFLSESNRKKISHRLLLASTNSLSRNAIRACQGQEKPITLFLRNDFNSAHVNYPEKLTDTQKPEKRKKPVPDPHQKTAINDVIKGFQTSNRGQLVMACGTGKTFTTLWVDEALCTESTLVLGPSLNLSQILSDWLFALNVIFSALCLL